ncbi:hypothetical protein OO009_06725 [Flavobacteriaceae bacterium KMM 6897]|nr:hypothetical protein [Flavobacteriaceae bacterium KMM 6897]
MNNLTKVFNTVKKESPILYKIVLFHFFLAILCLAGLLIDDRTLMGINVWIKPLKFAISDGIYIMTVGYLIGFYPYTKRKTNIINNIVAWTLLMETVIVVFQASRGIQSHYNKSSIFDALLFMSMGIFIGINVFVMVLFIFDTIRLKLKTSKPIQWAILLGWTVVFFGSWVGGQMIGQLAHNVGVADGGAGLPLVNWSTVAGDLRVAHFFGLHGIQLIPLFALWVSNRWQISSRKQILAVTIFGLLYMAWIGFTFYQASLGIPLLKL